ncbi:hypothetical protein RF55_25627, partial [Lasius niger]
MKTYANLQHMTEVDASTSNTERVCYLPHHGVLRDTSSSTKLSGVQRILDSPLGYLPQPKSFGWEKPVAGTYGHPSSVALAP